MTMPSKIWASEAKTGYGEWQDTKDGMPVPLPYIRADIVEELVGKMKALRDDAYGYDYLYETPFHGQVCEAIDDAIASINAIMEGK